MSTKIAINGFGRIGRSALKIALKKKDLEVVAINDLTKVETLAHLMKFDSVYGVYNEEVKIENDALVVADQKIKILAEKEPANLPWKELGVDLVIGSTGVFTAQEEAAKHLEAGAKKVIISANSKTETVPHFVLGVNEEKYNPEKNDIVSMCSCTSNCLANVLR